MEFRTRRAISLPLGEIGGVGGPFQASPGTVPPSHKEP